MESLPKHIEHFMENSGRLFESKSHPCGAGRHPISELSIIDIAVRLPRMCILKKCSISVIRLSGMQASMPCGKFCLCQFVNDMLQN